MDFNAKSKFNDFNGLALGAPNLSGRRPHRTRCRTISRTGARRPRAPRHAVGPRIAGGTSFSERSPLQHLRDSLLTHEAGVLRDRSNFPRVLTFPRHQLCRLVETNVIAIAQRKAISTRGRVRRPSFTTRRRAASRTRSASSRR